MQDDVGGDRTLCFLLNCACGDLYTCITPAVGRIAGWCAPPNSPTYSSGCQADYNIICCLSRGLSVFFHCIPMTFDNFEVSLSVRMCRLCVVFLLTSSYLVTTARTTYPSYSFIHLQNCSELCKSQYSYNFTTAVHLALDNLEDKATYSHASGDTDQILMGLEPDSIIPIIGEIPLQVRSNYRQSPVSDSL